MASQGRGGSPTRGPKPLSDILNDLFAARGLGRLQARADLETAWTSAVGESGARWTRVETLRNGVLTITVAHPTLLEELRSFQKTSLLQALRRSLPETTLHDIRFRVGPITTETPGDQARTQGNSGKPSSASPKEPKGTASPKRRSNGRPSKPGGD